eukprot:TRINITY_DN3085_c0_g1_i2.p1 TRINITY_DN3085_c0_g1~~TRINITY_DN3085_c0_g1_i2.p1  ORF type:complete len:223 (+),score=51.52 TRINITY_DN3085_c0_g1_i2:38-670(+)
MKKLFGAKKVDPQEQAKEWRKQLRSEARGLDRQIRKITMEEQKVTRSVKEAAKKGQNDVVRILAKELVGSKKAKNRIYCAKAQLHSVEMSIQQQAAQVKLTGAIARSTEVMSSMNELMKVGEIQATMRAMSQEMMKAGLIDEMVEETMESLDEVDEDEVDEEVDNVLNEIFKNVKTPNNKLPTPVKEDEPVAEEEEEDDELEARLNALKN